MKQSHVRTRMKRLLDELDYDFNRFTLEGFTEWLANRRNRKIAFVPRSLPQNVFGACVKGNGIDMRVLKDIVPSAVIFGAEVIEKNVDVVFYEAHTPVVHRAHNQLHELSHLICEHPTVEIGSRHVGLLRSTGAVDTVALESLLLRSTHSDEHEREAETLTNLIQERVLRHARLEELYKAISAEGGFTNYFAAYMEAMESGA